MPLRTRSRRRRRLRTATVLGSAAAAVASYRSRTLRVHEDRAPHVRDRSLLPPNGRSPTTGDQG